MVSFNKPFKDMEFTGPVLKYDSVEKKLFMVVKKQRNRFENAKAIGILKFCKNVFPDDAAILSKEALYIPTSGGAFSAESLVPDDKEFTRKLCEAHYQVLQHDTEKATQEVVKSTKQAKKYFYLDSLIHHHPRNPKQSHGFKIFLRVKKRKVESSTRIQTQVLALHSY